MAAGPSAPAAVRSLRPAAPHGPRRPLAASPAAGSPPLVACGPARTALLVRSRRLSLRGGRRVSFLLAPPAAVGADRAAARAREVSALPLSSSRSLTGSEEQVSSRVCPSVRVRAPPGLRSRATAASPRQRDATPAPSANGLAPPLSSPVSAHRTGLRLFHFPFSFWRSRNFRPGHRSAPCVAAASGGRAGVFRPLRATHVGRAENRSLVRRRPVALRSNDVLESVSLPPPRTLSFPVPCAQRRSRVGIG